MIKSAKKYYFETIFLFCLVFVMSFAAIAGSYYAKTKRIYTVIQNEVVIGQYKDKLIMKEFDDEIHIFKNTYRIIDIKDDIFFEEKEIGPIKPPIKSK